MRYQLHPWFAGRVPRAIGELQCSPRPLELALWRYRSFRQCFSHCFRGWLRAFCRA